MLLLSLFRRISNIADISLICVNLVQMIAESCFFLLQKKDSAYFLNPQHIKACKNLVIENGSLKNTHEINKWQLKIKLNSGENTQLIGFL